MPNFFERFRVSSINKIKVADMQQQQQSVEQSIPQQQTTTTPNQPVQNQGVTPPQGQPIDQTANPAEILKGLIMQNAENGNQLIQFYNNFISDNSSQQQSTQPQQAGQAPVAPAPQNTATQPKVG